MKKIILTASALLSACAFCATITVVAPQEGAAKSVTVGTSTSAEYAEGALAPLKATANAGWAFAGWYSAYDAGTGGFSGEVALAQSADWRTASANYVVGDADATLYARFVKPAGDMLSFDLEAVFMSVAVDVDDADRPVLSLTEAIDAAVPVESASFPTVSVAGLPSGLKFDAKSLRLSGTPTAPGVYRVSASAKNVSGYPFSQIFYVRVENAASEHVSGSDSSDYSVGSEVDAFLDEFFDISNTNSAVKTIGVKGLPAGLLLETEVDDGDVSYYVRGTPTKSGDNTVWCTVKFSDGTVEEASMLFTVGEPDPYDYGVTVDFSVLGGYCVGDSIQIDEEISIGEYDSESGVGVIAVSGLPAGVSAVKSASVGGYSYVLSGVFTKAGEYKVSVKIAYDDWENDTTAMATLSRNVIVDDSPGTYVSAAVLDEETAAAGCKVVGGGVYSSGATAKLTATAGSGYLFSGWCDFAGVPVVCGADDYRKSQASVLVGSGAELEWYAAFIPKDEDHVGLDDLDGAEMTVDPAAEEPFAYSFAVASGSLPTLKFSNLPAWLACAPSSELAGDYVLSYNPATSAKTPTPGRYRVAATATNLSRMSDTASFLVTVPNRTDADIHVEDDYGTLTPNVAMTPISFAAAVDFARGDTLAVTGLPAGLKYADRSLTGTPTKPGEYTLTFTAKIVTDTGTRTATATAYIKVKEFPTVAVNLSADAKAAGNKVTGAGSFKAGTKITLKAVAAKDWVFAGWGEGSGATGLAALNPSLQYVVGSADLSEVTAAFIHRRDDTLFVDDPGVVAVVAGQAFATNLVETIIETLSLPTVSVSGLPSGLKFDAKTFAVSGTVGKTAKPGYCYATLSAKNAGGYMFSRILKFVVLAAPGDPIPDEPQPKNEANIDFSDLDGIFTGDFLPSEGADAVVLYVAPADADVTAVSASGLPAGLKGAVTVEDGAAEILVCGTPTKPGRYTIKVQVTYADRSKATSEYAFIVEDGGSAWLDVESFDVAAGTVSGAGVYASGASVKLSAKPVKGYVFAGWYEDDGMPFDVLAATDGVDYRTASASFAFRRGMFSSDKPILYGGFVAKGDDGISVEGLDDGWEITPSESGELKFEIKSASRPKLTATGLPKGVTLDAAGGRFVYSAASADKIVPGFYTVTLKAVNQSNVSATEKLSVFVANKTTDAIGGLNPAADAYPLFAGVSLDPETIVPEVDVDAGWKLTVAGLPAGLKLVQDKDTKAYSVSGVATKAGTNTVTFTATKGRDKEVATITVSVAALPAWAVGTYDGAYFEFDDDGTNAVGLVSATVTAAGKVSGKVLKGGKSYSFTATSFGGYDADAGAFTAEVVVPWSTADKETFLISVGESGYGGLGLVFMEPVGDGAHFAEAVQNAWLRKDLSAPAFATGAKQPVLALASGAICKFGAKGVVTLSGKIGGVAASGKAQTLLVGEDGAGYLARVAVYVANKGFEGGAYCEVVDVTLSDTDGDGLIDNVH